MSPSRFLKRVVRRLTVSWREQPTQRDIEAVTDNVRRVGTVIRFRWILVGALTAFSIVAASVYLLDASMPRRQLLLNMVVPAVALVFVLGYNTFYQMTYRRLGNIAFLNHAQLLFDTLVITVLVYYSGGVYSWFYTMYALIVLEAGFIFTRRRDAWIVAGSAAAGYGAVLGLEVTRVLPHVYVPFVANDLQWVPTYVAVRYVWGITVIFGTTVASRLIMSALRRRESVLAEEASVDEMTGLHDRRYFQQQLSAEIQRARLHDRRLAVFVVDIDNFDEFNRTFGFEFGNDMLRAVAGEVERLVHDSSSRGAELNIVGRYGGEEFGIVLPEPPLAADSGRDAAVRELAERIRDAVGSLRVHDAGVTVSIGIAHFPEDGRTAGDLIASADQALFAAMSHGGNCVADAHDTSGHAPDALAPA